MTPMNISKILVASFVSVSILCQSTYAYMFGFKSWDNTPENIDYIEKTYKINLPIAGFIFDPWDDNTQATLIRAVGLL